MIAAILTTENVDDWVKVAQDNNTLTLIETVSTHVKKDKLAALTDQSAKHECQHPFLQGA